MKRVFLIHGWGGSPNNHWFPWLSNELHKNRFVVRSLEMPNSRHPKLDEWISTIIKEVGSVDSQTYFLGHSLGCITIARYLEGLKKGDKVGGCVFVAGFSGNIGHSEIGEFYSDELDIKKIKNHCENFVCIFSKDDGVVPLEKGMEFAEQLNAKVIIENGKGHFTTGDKVFELPSAFKSLMEVSLNN